MNKSIRLFTLFTLGFIGSLIAQPGTLDSTFGVNGIIRTQVGSSSAGVYTMLTQPDNNMVLIGNAYTDSNYDIALVRYSENGVIDKAFGANGFVLTDLAFRDDNPTAAVLQDDGKIIVLVQSRYDTTFSTSLIRYLPNGLLDSSFGIYGKHAISGATEDNERNAIALTSDGKIVVGGFALTAKDWYNAKIRINRFNYNGTIDSSFGINGEVQTTANGYAAIPSVLKINSQGKILIGGNTPIDSVWHLLLMQLNKDGSIDTSFGTKGVVTTFVGQGGGYVQALFIDDSGKIFLGGNARRVAQWWSEYIVLRYMPNGQLDSTFGNKGFADVPFHKDLRMNHVNSIAVQKNKKIVAVGYSTYQWAILVFNANGIPDYSFGDSGEVLTTLNERGRQEARSVDIQKSDKIIAAGYDFDDFIIIRYLSEFNLGILDFSVNNQSTLVYPNPIKDQTVLEYSLQKEEEISVHLMDMHGKIIKTFLEKEARQSGPQKEFLEFSQDIPSGHYLVVISSPNGKISVKVVK